MEQALLPRRLEDLAGEEAGHGGCRACLRDSLDALLKEAKDKFKGYDSCSTPEHAELANRKVRAQGFFFFLHTSVESICLLSVCLFVSESDETHERLIHERQLICLNV